MASVKGKEDAKAPSDGTACGNAAATATHKVQTFFSVMESSFVQLRDPSSSTIETAQFLACCRSVLPVFNFLGATVFGPVKADLQGNIDKLHEKYQTDVVGFAKLLDMVQKELDEGKNATSGRATEALLWLKRGLEFILHFLSEIHGGNEHLSDCAHRAYGKTLKQHHGWLVQGIFSVAVRAIPSMKTFKRQLAPSPQDASHPDYSTQLSTDCGEYVAALDLVLKAINCFYRERNLEL